MPGFNTFKQSAQAQLRLCYSIYDVIAEVKSASARDVAASLPLPWHCFVILDMLLLDW